MPNFKYVDDETRTYEQYGLVITGRVVEAEQAPDPRWEETTDAVTGPPKAPGFLKHGSPYEIAEDDAPEPEPAAPKAAAAFATLQSASDAAKSEPPASEPAEPPAPSA